MEEKKFFFLIKKMKGFEKGLTLAKLMCPGGSAHSGDHWTRSDSGLVMPLGTLHRLWGQ